MFRPLCLLLITFAALIQSGWGSWQYANGSIGTQGGFTYQTTVTEISTNIFTGTATLTAFSGSYRDLAKKPVLQWQLRRADFGGFENVDECDSGHYSGYQELRFSRLDTALRPWESIRSLARYSELKVSIGLTISVFPFSIYFLRPAQRLQRMCRE